MVIKMKDLIKVQNDMLREKFVHNRLDEQPVQSSQDKEDKSTEPQKLKIDIPDSPFEPDVNQIKDKLKHTLKQWQVKQYMSDKHRWKDYYKDILKLVNYLDGEK